MLSSLKKTTLPNGLVFLFKVIPGVMLNCTTEHKDVRYCVSQGSCTKAEVAAIQCYGENLKPTHVGAVASDSGKSAEVEGVSAVRSASALDALSGPGDDSEATSSLSISFRPEK